jgi:1-acyl-sn-glycerol-3-phosphate acyltransferase
MPKYRRWIWWVGWFLMGLVRPMLCRLQVEGRENVPISSGAVVASNHSYGPDYILLAFSSPRELWFMAKSEIFSWNPLLAAVLRAAGVFPVQRGKSDTAAIDTAVKLVMDNHLIAMFPEGTRSKSGVLMTGKTGAARIALAADAPIVPVAVINSAAVFKRKGWRRPLVTVRFGKPICWQAKDGADEAETARAFMDTVMREIASMLPQEFRGEYGALSKQEAMQNQVDLVR